MSNSPATQANDSSGNGTPGDGAGAHNGSANQQRPKWRRKNLLINPEFQLTVIAFFVGLAIVTIMVFYWSVHLIFGNFADQAREMGLPPGHILFQVIVDQQHTMNLIFLTTSILLFAFLVTGGIVLSFHIAGPIYRLRMHMQNVVAGGDMKDLFFRKKDFFQEIVTDYNELLAQMRKWRK